MPTWRFQPYGASGAHSNEYTNAEAGPSNLAPPLIPYVAPSTTHPSGGTSEATANAENYPTITEEDATPVSNFYCPRIPHVTEWLFGVRRPGVLKAQENRVTGASGIRKFAIGCVSGREGGRASRSFRASKKL